MRSCKCLHIFIFCTLQINVAQRLGPKVLSKWTTLPQRKISLKRTNGSKDWAQSAGMDNSSPRKNLLEKEPMDNNVPL